MVVVRVYKTSEFLAKSNGVNLVNHLKHVSEICKYIEGKHPKELEIIALLHDIGKIYPTFQKRLKSDVYPDDFTNLFPDIPHNIVSVFCFDKKELTQKYEVQLKPAITAIFFHHWREEMTSLLTTNEKIKVFAEKIVENKDVFNEILNDFGEELGIRGILKLDMILLENIRLGASIIDLDILMPPYKMKLSVPRHLSGYKEISNIINQSGLLKYSDHFASYIEDSGNNLSKEMIIAASSWHTDDREQIVLKEMKAKGIKDSEIWQKQKLNSIDNTILVANTGAGKTYFAYMWAKNRRLVFTLPLRSAVNALYARTAALFSRDKESVGLLHSDADIESRHHNENLSGFNIDVARHLAYPNIVTTGDQIFPAALQYPGYDKIYSILKNSALVVDEVQAYNPQAAAIVVKLLKDVSAIGGKFLLMTATLPPHIRAEIESFVEEKNIIDIYPEVFIRIRKHKLSIKLSCLEDSVSEFVKIASKGKRVLVIANTVKRATKIYKKIIDISRNKPEVGKIHLLHSRFTAHDRRAKEKAIEEIFPNNSEPKSGIFITTQIVEASLDISADYLYTDIAPMDSLIQRFGRILRYIRSEYSYEGDPNIIIHVERKGKKADFKISNAEVYPEEIVLKTLDTLLEIQSKSKEDLISEKQIDFTKALDESIKGKLVEKVYSNIENTSYIKNFKEALSILESGWMSDRKRDAQRIFRDINSVTVIPSNKLCEAINAIKSLIESNELTWINFKEKVLSIYAITIPQGKRRKSISKLERYITKNFDNPSNRLYRYCEGIYVYEEAFYDDLLGLVEK